MFCFGYKLKSMIAVPPMKKYLPFYFLIFLTACHSAVREMPPPYSREVATVDDLSVTEEDLRFRFRLEREKFPKEALLPNPSDPDGLTEKKLLRQIMDRMIDDLMIVAWGQRNDIIIPDDQLHKEFEERKIIYSKNALEAMLEEKHVPYGRWKSLMETQIRVNYVMEKALRKSVQVSAGEISSYYNHHRGEFTVPEQVHARHIVTDSKKKADEIYARLLKGENFALLAVEHSIAPERAKGGDLGYFSKGSFPKVFDDTCFKLEPGKISQIVKSEYGYHIFRVLDKKPARISELSEVAGKIQQELFEKKLKDAYQPWLETVRKAVNVQIDESLLGNFTL